MENLDFVDGLSRGARLRARRTRRSRRCRPAAFGQAVGLRAGVGPPDARSNRASASPEIRRRARRCHTNGREGNVPLEAWFDSGFWIHPVIFRAPGRKVRLGWVRGSFPQLLVAKKLATFPKW